MVVYIAFGFGQALYLFDTGLILWAIETSAMYLIIKLLAGRRGFVPLFWGLNVATLFCNEYFGGYRLAWFHKSLAPWDDRIEEAPIRWNHLYNLNILRMISFALDKHWAILGQRSLLKGDSEKDADPAGKDVDSYRARQETNQAMERYNVWCYFGYLFYPPLFITGPIATFNAWVSQVYVPQTTYSVKDLLFYAGRVVFCFLATEIWVHTQFSRAIGVKSVNSWLWAHLTMSELLFMLFGVLIFLW
jgi:D-alanyl-lipoteichoic acid acyltransferase DltB (MBOAT superfamily)